MMAIPRFDRIENYPLRISREEKEIYHKFFSDGFEFSLIAYIEHEMQLAKTVDEQETLPQNVAAYLEREIGIWYREECLRRKTDPMDTHRAKDAIQKRLREKSNLILAAFYKQNNQRSGPTAPAQ
jgi:hypothetical protein